MNGYSSQSHEPTLNFLTKWLLLFFHKVIDRFKKFARLGTSLSISDAITSISATMRDKRTSDDLAKSIYRFKNANPDYANSAIARIFSISESTLRGILKRRIGQKKSNWVGNLYSQEESSVSVWAALIETQNSGFLTFCSQPDDLSPMPRHTGFF